MTRVISLPRHMSVVAEEEYRLCCTCAEAQELLEGEDRERFIAFSGRLSRTLDGDSIITFPAPFILADPLTEAEAMAEQYLCEGSGSLWSALRMVARCLDYETDTRQHAGGLSFRLGLTKQSRRHYSVARLFNAAIAHVLSTHTWTTMSVDLDNMTVPHYDRGNAPGGSLLLGLTHHSAGGLWICDGSGSQLLEAEGVLSAESVDLTEVHSHDDKEDDESDVRIPVRNPDVGEEAKAIRFAKPFQRLMGACSAVLSQRAATEGDSCDLSAIAARRTASST
eukprot:s9072_g3.t1